MKNQKIAVLLTCYNRKEKTISCLSSFFEADIPINYHFDIFLTDDGSTDGTEETITNLFPSINIIKGSGNLFWAGGMRLAWNTALELNKYNAFLLLNDDVILKKDFINNLLTAESFAFNKTNKKGIYSGATIDKETNKITYGSSKINKNNFIVKIDLLTPSERPQECEITNANILWVDKSVVDEIGILDRKYTHGIADYDYSLKAHKKGLPVYLAPNICGICQDDHGKNWKDKTSSLKERIIYLKSPRGLAYKEYLFYIRRHFPLNLPYSFIMLWMKTLFPFVWDRLKKEEA
ncbi:MAG: glycosyltransferase family 2 protein [Proteiniphilum sp.]|nr:glycosyltransferase family 2 protein [Proteiniphilum sp.]